jgi:hypothetical protein
LFELDHCLANVRPGQTKILELFWLSHELVNNRIELVKLAENTEKHAKDRNFAREFGFDAKILPPKPIRKRQQPTLKNGENS